MTFEEVKKAHEIYAAKKKKFLFISLGIWLITLPLLFLGSLTCILNIGAILFFIADLSFNFTARKEHDNYTKAYRTYFVAASLAKIFNNISYDHSYSMPRETVEIAMTTADRYSSNDFMTATYKNINFAQADIHTEREYTTTDSDGHTSTHYSTVFRGRFLIFDFNRNFSTNLQVASHNFNGAKLSRSANHLKFEKIKTESDEFNKNFDIFAEDGVDALYILDPAFMEKIQKLYTDCKHEILLTFINKKVYIAINDGKDSLEPPKSIRKPLDEKVELEKVQKDILVITNFVDSLDLDQYFKEKK